MEERDIVVEEEIGCEEFCVHQNILKHFDNKLISDEQSQDAAALFKALGDATRIKILYYLTQEPLCVCDLSVLVGTSQSAISHQLRVLSNLQIVQGRKEGKQVIYSICDAHIQKVLLESLAYRQN